ncbi:hypothetical protein BZZ01_25955 [Nostocales cyanobacterium HT-58-2]|nr:hypothetical protein BZZ01_25955 [Nostocales cyanobacterium HT-58-2]
MSYVSLLKNIPEFLSQPTGIAAIASLGIHGAIALLLPIVPMASKPKQEQPSSKSSVGLVELSQAEQSRLPKPATPQLSLQPQAPVLPQVPPTNFANQSIPPLPPLPPPAASTELILPPLPKTDNLAVASLPKGQSLPILSKRDLQPDTSLRTKSRPFSPFVDRVKLGEPKPLESARIPDNIPPVQAANIPQEQDLVNTAAPMSSDQVATALPQGSTATQTTQPGDEVSQVARKQQLVTPVVQPPQARDSSIALGGQNLPQLPQGSNFTAPELPPLAAERSLSTPKTFAERFTEVKNQYPNLETKQPIAAIVDAKAGTEGNVEGDLVVNPQGQVESINFLDNSVASELKTSVREYFRQYFQSNPVQANGKPKFYPFNISFKLNSSNISKTPAQGLSTSSQVNQAQRSLVQRLRSVEVSSQPSKEPQKLNQVERLRSSSVNQQVSQTNQKTSAPQASQERQTSKQQVILRQTTSAPQTNKEEQTSRQQVVVRQSASSLQTNKEEQTSQQQVVVRQSTSAPQTNQEQTSQEEATNNQPSASIESSKKLLQQLRQIRDKRQTSNQEK